MKRGDVVLVRFPHPSGQRGKKRPAVVVQSDAYAGTVSTVVVATGMAPYPLRARWHRYDAPYYGSYSCLDSFPFPRYGSPA